jgi:hypothetical protein
MQMAVIEAARNLAGLWAMPGPRSSTTRPARSASRPWSITSRNGCRATTRSPQGRPTTRAARCGWAPMTRCWRGLARGGGLRHDRHRGTPPPPLRGRHQVPRGAGGEGLLMSSPACRPTAACPRSSNGRPPVVHRRAVPPRAEVQTLRAASRCSRISCARAKDVLARVAFDDPQPRDVAQPGLDGTVKRVPPVTCAGRSASCTRRIAARRWSILPETLGVSELYIFERIHRGSGGMTPKKHVTSRQNDRAHAIRSGSSDDDQPALPGIDVLVGLRGIAGDASPCRPEGVPFHSAPMVWAQSSITADPVRTADLPSAGPCRRYAPACG